MRGRRLAREIDSVDDESASLEPHSREAPALVRTIPGVSSALAEQSAGHGRPAPVEPGVGARSGLGNRTHALRELERALLRQARRATGYTAVMFLDLDRFKQVNDTFGHQAGDQVLTAVAGKLHLVLRTTDTCARYGGDEFLVVSENLTSISDGLALAERLITLIAGTYPLSGAPSQGATDAPRLTDNGVSIHSDGAPRTTGQNTGSAKEADVGVSIGIVVSASSTPAAELLQAADEAMYEAKNKGGNTHAVRYL